MKVVKRIGIGIVLLSVIASACARTPTAERTPIAAPRPTLAKSAVTPTVEGAASATPAPAAPTPESIAATELFELHLPLIAQVIPTPTSPPPTEAPPPTPAWPEPRAGLTNSKISLHALGPSDPYIMELVRRAKPRVVKSVGDFGWLAEVKAVSPETVTVGRVSGWENEAWIETVDPGALAEKIVADQLETYRLNPGVDYWEGWNEFVPVTPERMRWFAQVEAARACLMQAHGLRAAVGGFSTGVPEYDLMDDFLPALEAAQRCGGIFQLHEYNAPTLDCGVATGVPNIIAGAPALSVPAGPLTLRYRFWYEGLLKPRGLGDVRLVISEFGIDFINQPCDGREKGTWKTYQDWWVQRGLGQDGPQAYVNQMAWYDAQIRQDVYVIGATVFTAGAVSAGSWNAHDVHDVIIPLTYYLVSQ